MSERKYGLTRLTLAKIERGAWCSSVTLDLAAHIRELEDDLRSARATALEQETRAQNAEMALATLRTRLAGSVHHSDQHMPAAECASELASVCDVLEGDERRAGQADGVVRAVAGPCDVDGDGREVVS